MSVLDKYCRSAHRRLDLLQIDAQEEAWKAAYIEAERCHFFEMVLNTVVDAFQFIQGVNHSWRTAVYRGIEAPDVRTDESVKECFSRWLKLARGMARDIQEFERLGYLIEKKDEVWAAIAAVEHSLAHWLSPVPARSSLMRFEEVSEEEADELRAILNAPLGSPGKLAVEPARLPGKKSS